MKKTKIISGAIIILLLLGLGVYFFMLKNPLPENNLTQEDSFKSNFESSNVPLTYQVGISEYKFSPSVTVVPKGSKVVWTNNDPVVHTVTSDNGTELASSLIANGTAYYHIFNISGTFDYHCSMHPTMKGQVIVQ
jgi:plastocyanin